MLAIILFYLAVSVISGGILFYFMKSAPTGYEDEFGFHVGTKEVADVKSRKFQKVI
jgi:hypothetical protein